MIGDLKPYAQYADSGLAWLGRVPAHWQVRRTKTLLREVDRRSASGREPLLSLRMLAGLVDHHALGGKPVPPTVLVGYKHIMPGEIVMNRMRAAAGLFAKATSEGLVSPDYAVFEVGHELHGTYAVHLFKTPMMADIFRSESTGLGTGESGFLRLYSDQFMRLAIPTPPPNEQAAIMRFLHWANGRLERAIRAKRKVIALLDEQKQAIIHRAVTRGLDPSVPLKPSGVPWLGYVPTNWEVAPIGSIVTLLQTGPFGSQLHSHEYVRSAIPVINPSHMSDGRLRPSAEVTISQDKASELARHMLREGDVVIARRGVLGRCALVTEAEEGWICGTGSLLLRCKTSLVSPAFFQTVFASRGIAETLGLVSIGATMANINERTVARQRFPLPPLADQEQIVDFVRQETETVELAAGRLELEIELLREYRTRLVADVVTGKLDVREAAARLPAEAADASAGEEADPADDAEELDEEAAA